MKKSKEELEELYFVRGKYSLIKSEERRDYYRIMIGKSKLPKPEIIRIGKIQYDSNRFINKLFKKNV